MKDKIKEISIESQVYKRFEKAYKYALEMVCDGIAAGKVYLKKDFTMQRQIEFWLQKIKVANALPKETGRFVLLSLIYINKCLINNIRINKKEFKKIYKKVAQINEKSILS
jgi:hypothetical protein